MTLSSHHSQGNGFSEEYVKICVFTKSKTANTDSFIGHWNTEIQR